MHRRAVPGVAVGGEARNQLGALRGAERMNALLQSESRTSRTSSTGAGSALSPNRCSLFCSGLNNRFVHNYGWAIVLLTIIINIALFPLKLTNLKSMRKMQVLQPEMTKINEKYKGIGMSDPRAANKQQETMDLYKKHGVNPMGGCIPMLIQLPFL